MRRVGQFKRAVAERPGGEGGGGDARALHEGERCLSRAGDGWPAGNHVQRAGVRQQVGGAFDAVGIHLSEHPRQPVEVIQQRPRRVEAFQRARQQREERQRVGIGFRSDRFFYPAAHLQHGAGRAGERAVGIIRDGEKRRAGIAFRQLANLHALAGLAYQRHPIQRARVVQQFAGVQRVGRNAGFRHRMQCDMRGVLGGAAADKSDAAKRLRPDHPFLQCMVAVRAAVIRHQIMQRRRLLVNLTQEGGVCHRKASERILPRRRAISCVKNAAPRWGVPGRESVLSCCCQGG
ncbi:MAG: hypothetical protein BWY76_03180 [bacterium ADurb.Bin429]|nr:MAG: hypothetical protein BWY76_03180 [bacterium ADurb.Bin429]